jgi:hypothetical protein
MKLSHGIFNAIKYKYALTTKDRVFIPLKILDDALLE